MATDRVADRLDIAETIYRYAEAIDLIGANPVAPRAADPVRPAVVESYIESQHWMADGRHLSAPIEYEDEMVRGADSLWRIKSRDIVVWRWWVTEGYAPTPSDPTLSRPS